MIGGPGGFASEASEKNFLNTPPKGRKIPPVGGCKIFFEVMDEDLQTFIAIKNVLV